MGKSSNIPSVCQCAWLIYFLSACGTAAELCACSGAGGHNVIAGLFDHLEKQHPGSKLLGFLDGPRGVMNNNYRELAEGDMVCRLYTPFLHCPSLHPLCITHTRACASTLLPKASVMQLRIMLDRLTFLRVYCMLLLPLRAVQVFTADPSI